MSSAKRKFVIVLPPILAVLSWSSSASAIILSKQILKKRAGESRHPLRTPTVVWNHSPMLSWQTALVSLLLRHFMVLIRLSMVLYNLMVAHKAA